MRSFEMIGEIENSCSNNQMRDVFFEEVDCDSPAEYVRSLHAGKNVEITQEEKSDGSIVVYVNIEGLIQKYIFTEI